MMNNVPQSSESEQSLLGAMLLENDAVEPSVAVVEAYDFYHESHRLVFSAIKALHERGVSVDLLSVCEQLHQNRQLEEVGGPAYIGVLIEACPTSANATEYARRVRQDAILRRML
jgi:replicative DNA helicase